MKNTENKPDQAQAQDNSETKHRGAPKKGISFPDTPFTIKELGALNSGVCLLTIRNRVNEAVKNGTLTEMAEGVKTGKVGKPSSRYTKTEVVNFTPTQTMTPPTEAPNPVATPTVEPTKVAE